MMKRLKARIQCWRKQRLINEMRQIGKSLYLLDHIEIRIFPIYDRRTDERIMRQWEKRTRRLWQIELQLSRL